MTFATRWLVRSGIGIFALTPPVVAAPAQIASSNMMVASAERGPKFLVETGKSRVPVDISHTTVLRRRITVYLDDVPLRQALAEVADKAGIQLMYADDVVPVQARVRLRADGITVAAALTDLLVDASIDVVFTPAGDATLVKQPVPPSLPQFGVLTGHVRNALSGEPLVSASVVVIGTRLGTKTEEDGSYRIAQVPVGDQTITVRRLGFHPLTRRATIADGATASLDFALEFDVLRMDEVVVTGNSGETERRQLGNSLTTVDADAFRQSGSVSVDGALAGKAPGVMVQQNSGNPGGGISVRLRGTSTILGSADPLYVIDGVIVNNSAPQLLYLGGYTQNRLVDLNPDDIDHIEIVKGAAAAALYGSRANNGVVQIFTKSGSSGATRLNWYSSYSSDNLRKRLAVNRYPYDASGAPVQRYDQQDEIFQTAHGAENGGSIAGTSGDTRYYLSGSYVNDDGIVRQTNFRRTNSRIRLDIPLAAWATVSVGGSVSVSKEKDVPNGGLGALIGAIDGFLFGPNTYSPLPDANGVYAHGSFANPAEVIAKYQYSQKTNRFIGNAHLTLTPIDGLKLEYTLGSDSYTQTGLAFIPRGVGTPGIYNLGFSQNGSVNLTQVNNDVNATYTRRFLTWLQSTSAVGATFQSEISVSQGASSYDLSPVSQIVPSGANKTVTESRSKRLVQGAFGQQTIGIADRLFLTAAYRLDASSVFAPNVRLQSFPKVSGSYLLSDESFWRNSVMGRVLPQFKLRAAWGQSGGLTAIGPFDRFTNYNPVSYEGNPGLNPGRQEGSDIKPERQTAFEAGVETTLLSDRLGFEMNVYKQHTSDLLLTRSVALTTGYSTQLENIGTIDNRGIELLMKVTPVSTRAVEWNTTLSYSANRNVVSDIAGGVKVLTGSWGLAAAVNGYPLGVYYAAGFKRDSEGRIIDTNGNPYTDPATQVPATNSVAHVIGDPNPRWIGAWTNSVKLGRNFTIHTQLDGVIGQDVWNYDDRVGANPSYCTLWLCADELSGKIAKGRGAAMYTNFEYWVEKGSYMKVREVSATYTLHPGTLGIRELEVGVIGRNLYSFDSYLGYDPETNAGGQSTGTRGYEFAEVPIPRSIAFRISTSF